MSPWPVVLEFTALAVAIGFAGFLLSIYGDVIAEKTGLGGAWIGFALMAVVTSLPELATGLSAAGLNQLPDIALGDALGSCVFNLMLIVLLDFLHREASVYTRASQGHILASAFGIVLLGFIAFNIVLAHNGIDIKYRHIALATPITLVFYVIAMHTVFRYEKSQHQEALEELAERYPHISLSKAIKRYSLAAICVVALGIRLPETASKLAEVMGWEQSFVGTVFVALATSLPELVVTISALQIGALDMAMSDLFGSNLFNLLIVALDDLVYLPGSILAAALPVHLVTVLSAIMMNGIAITGLLYRPTTRLFKTIGWVSLAMFSVYVVNMWVLYLHR